MEFKLFEKPQFHDEAFHKDREVADHIHQAGHRRRLLESLELIVDICEWREPAQRTLADYGAGNGGLLAEIKKRLPGLETWGYDISPKAIEDGRKRYGVNLEFLNIATENPRPADVVVLTEILEHLIHPHRLLEKLFHHPVRWLVASSPAAETPEHHYEFHNWCWTGDSYADMFERAGWTVRRHFAIYECGTQFVVAAKGGR